MEQIEVIKRIKYLIGNLGMSQAEFAQRIGLDPSNLSKYINGRLAINESLINKMVVNLNVSKTWLTEGSDIPFPKSGGNVIHTVNVPAVTTTAVQRGTPVYDIDVTAGTMPRAMMFADEQIVGYVDMPDVVNSNCRIVKVSGDSMSPVIQNGDYIAVRELSNFNQIFWGQIYVVLLDDYRMVKYVRRHADPSMVILRSENPKYDDMEIARADIRDLMLVQNILHLDSRL